jgi:hypothetical protein
MKEYRDVTVGNSALYSGIPAFKSVYPANVKHTGGGPCEISCSVYSKCAASAAANNNDHELLWTKDEQRSPLHSLTHSLSRENGKPHDRVINLQLRSATLLL